MQNSEAVGEGPVIYVRTLRVDDGKQGTVDFPDHIEIAHTVIQGFDLGYFDKEHKIKEIHVGAWVTSLDDKTVTVQGTCNMRNNSGDHASGTVGILVLGITKVF